MGPEGRVSEGPLRVPVGVLSEGWMGTHGVVWG